MATADRTTKLGDELTVSAIGFGAMALTPVYGDVDDAESLATLNRCLDLGVTFIDTANVYGGGNNERLICQAARRPPRRGHPGDEVRHRQQPGRPRGGPAGPSAATPPTCDSASTRALRG